MKEMGLLYSRTAFVNKVHDGIVGRLSDARSCLLRAPSCAPRQNSLPGLGPASTVLQGAQKLHSSRRVAKGL
jgi:hypothetical protein